MFTVAPCQLCLNPLFFFFLLLPQSTKKLYFFIQTGLPESLSVYFTGKCFISLILKRSGRMMMMRRIVSSVPFILSCSFPMSHTSFLQILSPFHAFILNLICCVLLHTKSLPSFPLVYSYNLLFPHFSNY